MSYDYERAPPLPEKVKDLLREKHAALGEAEQERWALERRRHLPGDLFTYNHYRPQGETAEKLLGDSASASLYGIAGTRPTIFCVLIECPDADDMGGPWRVGFADNVDCFGGRDRCSEVRGLPTPVVLREVAPVELHWTFFMRATFCGALANKKDLRRFEPPPSQLDCLRADVKTVSKEWFARELAVLQAADLDWYNWMLALTEIRNVLAKEQEAEVDLYNWVCSRTETTAKPGEG